jgi:reactive intermediate/imine deaminase
MIKESIHTPKAPAAIGTYSQAIKVGSMVFLSGQIPLDPKTMTLVDGPIETQIRQVLDNLSAVATAAGGSLQQVVKLNVFLTDLAHFAKVNEIMTDYFQTPYPARAAIGVSALPRGSQVEMDAILTLEAD